MKDFKTQLIIGIVIALITTMFTSLVNFPVKEVWNSFVEYVEENRRMVEEGGSVKDPYKLLPKLFKDASDKDYHILSEEDELCNGGAALTAYARMQFTEMGDYEREELRKGLLKYCELDTMAMVMLFEGWQHMI